MQQLNEELTRQKKAAELAHDEAISHESQPENKWDTHSQEAAYLAEGQAKLALEVGESIEQYGTMPWPEFSAGDVIALGAVVALESERSGKRSWYLVGPRAGGLEVTVDDRRILVVTPQSPIGKQLIGKRVGDAVQSNDRIPVTQKIVAVE